MSVLVVDEDEEARAWIVQAALESGFAVHEAAGLAQMDEQVSRQTFALIIMEIKFAREDGLAACRDICATQTSTVIVVSRSADVLDRILALEFGAADFLVKPTHPRELLARMRIALTQKVPRGSPRRAPSSRPNTYAFAGYELHLDRQTLSLPNGASRHLTSGECSLLTLFLTNPRRIINREELASYGFGECGAAASRAIDANVKRLRQKLRMNGENDIIRTVKGVGYIMDELVTPADTPAAPYPVPSPGGPDSPGAALASIELKPTPIRVGR